MIRSFKVTVELEVSLELEPGECSEKEQSALTSAASRAYLRAINQIVKGEGKVVVSSPKKTDHVPLERCF